MFDLFAEQSRLRIVMWPNRGRIKSLVIEPHNDQYGLFLYTTQSSKVHLGYYSYTNAAYLLEDLTTWLYEHHGQYVEKEGEVWPLPKR